MKNEDQPRAPDDPPRAALRALLGKRKDADLKAVSLAIRMNHSYLFQYLTYGKPQTLPENVREALGEYFNVPPDVFRKGAKGAVKVKTAIALRRLGESVTVKEIDVAAAAGIGEDPLTGFNDQHVVGNWTVPSVAYVQMSASPAERMRIISVIGDSMTPTLLPGQRVMVDTTDKIPSPPGLFVLWDGFSLVIKRLEPVVGSDPPTIRVMSDNKHYTTYERTLDEAFINGRVIGMWARS